MGLRSKHICDFIKKQSMETSFFFLLDNCVSPSQLVATGVWLLKDCRCLFDWSAVISAAQKQGRPHCGTDTQPLPRLFQLESKKKKEEEEETKTNRVQNSGEVYYEAGYDCAQLTFDRSSIVHTPIVQSLFPVFGCHGTKTSDGQELAKLF